MLFSKATDTASSTAGVRVRYLAQGDLDTQEENRKYKNLNNNKRAVFPEDAVIVIFPAGVAIRPT